MGISPEFGCIFGVYFIWIIHSRLTAVGVNLHSGGLEQEIRAGHSSVVHHAPADVGVHIADLVAAVYELQAELKVIAHADLQRGQDQVHVGLRELGLLPLTAVLLRLLHDGALLGAAWVPACKEDCGKSN